MLNKPFDFKHPFNFDRCSARLYGEYKKYGNLIVAFDFDNTIFDYHNNGGDYSQVISLLAECSSLDFTMVLFTVNDDPKKLEWITEYCKHFGIKVDFINDSPVLQGKGKPYYNILLDDRAGLEEAYRQLHYVVTTIKKINENNQLSQSK